MATLTNEQFAEQIKKWLAIAAKEDIKLPNGRALPAKVFHVFLGVGYSTFKMMYTGELSKRDVQPYIAKTIHFINLLDEKTLIKEIRASLAEYIEIYQKQ